MRHVIADRPEQRGSHEAVYHACAVKSSEQGGEETRPGGVTEQERKPRGGQRQERRHHDDMQHAGPAVETADVQARRHCDRSF